MNIEDLKVVLVVDDDAGVRNTVAALFRERGVAVLVAPHGAKALAIAAAHQGDIDLLISDIKMPGMSGIALAALFNEKWPATRILLMSSFEGSEWAYVKWDFIAKPFSPDHLLLRVGSLFDDAAHTDR